MLAQDSLAAAASLSWVDWSEIVRNYAAAGAVVVGLFAWFRWRADRSDQAAEVLFKLEGMFNGGKIPRGRMLLEEDKQYDGIRGKLRAACDGRAAAARSAGALLVPPKEEGLDDIDELLRFYVLLYGLREAGQAPNRALRACYRYWLAHYYHKDRTEFTAYIDEFYPTLKDWMQSDEKRWLEASKFAPPGEFRWDKRKPARKSEKGTGTGPDRSGNLSG